MPRMSAYAASKAAVVWFTETLAADCLGQNIDVNAVAPGALNTGMLEEVSVAGPEKVGSAHDDRAVRQKEHGGATQDRATELCVFLLSRQSDAITGKVIIVVWDPWELLPQRRKQLQNTDVYALQRSVTKDRGLDWD